MPTSSDYTYGKYGRYDLCTNARSTSGNNSPVVNGKLILRANAVGIKYGRLSGCSIANSYNGTSPPSANSEPGFPYWVDSDYTRAAERWNGAIKDGSASLAVTLAQYTKTKEMVTEKMQMAKSLLDRDLNKMNLSINSIRKDVERTARLQGKTPAAVLYSTAASRYLEGIFGWAPLIADAKALTGSVFSKGVPPAELSKQYSRAVQKSISSTTKASGRIKIRIQGFVAISNPNGNLIQRTGGTDLAAAAWDIIPWSFVVGMFVNVNAMITDIKGFPNMTMSNVSTTTTQDILVEWRSGVNFANTVYKHKTRTLGRPPVNLRFKSPPFTWGTAAMAASLCVQQMTKTARNVWQRIPNLN